MSSGGHRPGRCSVECDARRTAAALATCGPLRSFVGGRFPAGRRASRQAAPCTGSCGGAEQSAGTVPCPGLLHLRAVASRNSRRDCVRCVQTAAPGQSTKRAARADRRPGLAGRAGPGGPAVRKAQAAPRTACVPACLLVATEIASAGYPLPRDWMLAVRHESPNRPCEGAPGQDGARGRARSALRHLTRRGGSSAVSNANEASSATGHETEHRRGVGASAPTAEVKRPGLPGRAFDAEVNALKADTCERVQRAGSGRPRPDPCVTSWASRSLPSSSAG